MKLTVIGPVVIFLFLAPAILWAESIRAPVKDNIVPSVATAEKEAQEISQAPVEPTPYIEGTIQTFDVLDEAEDLPEE